MHLSSIAHRLSPLFSRLAVGIFITLGAVGATWAQADTPGSTASHATEMNEVTSRVIASHQSIRSSQTFTLAWQVKLAEGWHIYYSNAGDSGLPPALATADGFSAGPLTFPTPHVINIPPITNYGYEDEVTFTTEVTAPDNLSDGTTINLPLKLTFLFCKDVCLPGLLETTLPLTVAAEPVENPAFRPVADAQLITLPQPQPADVAAVISGSTVMLTFPASLTQPDTPPHFIPNADGVLNDSAAQFHRTSNGQTQLILTLDPQATTPPTELDGLLVTDPGVSYHIKIPLVPGPIASPAQPSAPAEGLSIKPDATGASSLWVALASAFVAGLILNLMPCVLPVLALKVLGVVKGHHGGKAWHHSAAYTVGILVTFAAFAVIFAGLKHAGMAVGWGFHLQSPYVVAGLAALMLTLALNLFGVFEAGTSLTHLALTAPAKTNHHVREAFITGLLAVIVATPCTVPFMGGAMAYALTEASFLTSLLTFLTLGFGMAAPFILLTSIPALVRYIPKPGAWMVTFKQLLGWPMLATAIWLVWICGNQTSAATQLALMFWLTALAAALWFYGRHHHQGMGGWLRLLPAALALAGTLHAVTPPPPTTVTWHPWSAEAVRKASTSGPVFVDFTADWCLTCKVTEATVLTTDATQQLFAQTGTTLFKGDWTRQDPAITAELERHGRKGVPLYLLYMPGKAVEILPQLLSQALLMEKLIPAAK